jgi:putative oxidoreductase
MQTLRKDAAAAITRITLGSMFLAHGLLKVLVFSLPGTVAFFDSLGLPGFLAYVVTVAEILGGALLVLGYRTRLVAALLTPVLLGATWAHLGNGWLFSNPNGGWEYPLFLAIIAVVVAMQGPGAWAVQSERA